MLRLNHGAAILLGILLLNGCSKTKTYRIASDSKVPAEVAAAIKGRTFHEGRNLLVDFDNKEKCTNEPGHPPDIGLTIM